MSCMTGPTFDNYQSDCRCCGLIYQGVEATLQMGECAVLKSMTKCVTRDPPIRILKASGETIARKRQEGKLGYRTEISELLFVSLEGNSCYSVCQVTVAKHGIEQNTVHGNAMCSYSSA